MTESKQSATREGGQESGAAREKRRWRAEIGFNAGGKLTLHLFGLGSKPTGKPFLLALRDEWAVLHREFHTAFKGVRLSFYRGATLETSLDYRTAEPEVREWLVSRGWMHPSQRSAA